MLRRTRFGNAFLTAAAMLGGCSLGRGRSLAARAGFHESPRSLSSSWPPPPPLAPPPGLTPPSSQSLAGLCAARFGRPRARSGASRSLRRPWGTCAGASRGPWCPGLASATRPCSATTACSSRRSTRPSRTPRRTACARAVPRAAVCISRMGTPIRHMHIQICARSRRYAFCVSGDHWREICLSRMRSLVDTCISSALLCDLLDAPTAPAACCGFDVCCKQVYLVFGIWYLVFSCRACWGALDACVSPMPRAAT